MKKIFGTDGARGKVFSELSCDLAYKIGAALSVYLSHKDHPRLLIGCDTRISSNILAMSLMSGISVYGAEATFVGVISTPAVAYLTKKEGFDGAVMISASHNPSEYNGIKLLTKNGEKFSDNQELIIENLVSDLPTPDKTCKNVLYRPKLRNDYISYLLSISSQKLDGIKIAIDCANGSACATAKQVFCKLGADVIMLSDKPNGTNINQKCGSTDTALLKSTVIEKACDLGIAFDGDADRCIMIDNLGNEIDGDCIMAIAANDLMQRGMLDKNSLVFTVMSNYGLHIFCKEHGINAVITPVGDRYVSQEMKKSGYCLGGEQSGHIIFGRHTCTGDGQLTAILMLDIIRRSGLSLSQLASVIKKYPQTLVNVEADETKKAAFNSSATIKKEIERLEASLGTNGGRVLVRASGTEPLIRIMAEGKDTKSISDIVCKLRDMINKL